MIIKIVVVKKYNKFVLYKINIFKAEIFYYRDIFYI